MTRPRRLALACALGVLLASPALAQTVSDPEQAQVRPGDEKLPEPPLVPEPELRRPGLLLVPDFEPDARAQPRALLPPLELPDVDRSRAAAARIEEIRVAGNTVLPPADVERVTRRFTGRSLAWTELDDLRDALTRLYLDAGYVTSGAVIPPQSVRDGVLEVQMVEGRLAAVEVENPGRLRESYVRQRLERDLGEVVQVDRLRARLVVLQRDPRIESVHAELLAGAEAGQARLRVRVVESRAWWLRVAGGNLSSPLIGEWRGDVAAGHLDVLGFGDRIEGELRLGETLRDVRVQLGLPVTSRDTLLLAFGRGTWSRIVEDPLADFDIESATETWGIAVEQPVHRTLRSQALLFAGGEWRRSRSSLLGRRFSFTPGPENGVATLAVLRLGASFEHSGSEQALALRSQLSIGLDALGATSHPGDVPDGQFVAWLNQLNYVRRLPFHDVEAALRGELQLSPDPLLGLEQFALGGTDSLRGFRRNQLVRDDGVVGSAELRIPVPLPELGAERPQLALVPFVDAGHGWNVGRPGSQRDTLVSVGLGLRADLLGSLHLAVYWGEPLAGGTHGSGSLQDSGVSLEVIWSP